MQLSVPAVADKVHLSRYGGRTPGNGGAPSAASSPHERSAAAAADATAATRAKNGNFRVALLLRRRVGSLREDRDFDTIVRHKQYHIFAFSMVGLLVMMVTQLATWYSMSGDGVTRDAYVGDSQTPPTLVNTLYIAQVMVTASTLVTIGLITQQYRLTLMAKRAEWSGSNLFEVEALQGGASANSLLRDRFEQSYVFSRSRLKWKLLLEVLIHLPHPLVWMNTANATGTPPNFWFRLFQAFMFLRLYLVRSLIYLSSEAYISRFEVVTSDRDLLSVGYQIQPSLTLKILFYQYTIPVLLTAILASFWVFGFIIYCMGRQDLTYDPQVTDAGFGSIWNSFWFAAVTFSTAGYGDYAPTEVFGRIVSAVTVVIGIGVFTIFSAVLVGRVSLSKEQKHGVEYLATRAADDVYREAAQTLIVAAVQRFIVPRVRAKVPELFDDAAGGGGGSGGKDDPDAVGGDPTSGIISGGLNAHSFSLVAAMNPAIAASGMQLHQLGHKANRLHKSIKDFRNARKRLEGSFAQADDTVFAQKMAIVDKLAEAVQRELLHHQKDFARFEDRLQGRVRSILTKVAQYDRLGHVAV